MAVRMHMHTSGTAHAYLLTSVLLCGTCCKNSKIHEPA
ncbi:unnamed protein product, partial [Ectocarpus sp. 4 AP-2014]